MTWTKSMKEKVITFRKLKPREQSIDVSNQVNVRGFTSWSISNKL